jgi:hypothetical protein
MTASEEWLVGQLREVGGADDRVYRRRLPETATLPAISYTRISTVPEYTHDGDSRLPAIRYQVDCWADNPDTADEMTVGLYERLSGTRQPGAQAVFIDNDLDDEDSESATYRRVLDVIITWAELEGSG